MPHSVLGGIVFAVTPTILVGLLFWFAMRAIFRADRTERAAYTAIEAEERAKAEAEEAGVDWGFRVYPGFRVGWGFRVSWCFRFFGRQVVGFVRLVPRRLCLALNWVRERGALLRNMYPIHG